MTKVQVVYTKMCPHCPAAKELFRDLKKELKFDYEEVDATTDEGQKIAQKHNIMAVPSIIINDRLTFVGVPSREKAIQAIKS